MTSRSARTSLWSGVILASGIAAGLLLNAARRPHDLLSELARETRGQGVVGLRLSVVSALRPCLSPRGAEHRERSCEAAPAAPSTHALLLIRRAGEAALAGVDPDALHAAAVANLVYSGGAGNLLDQSISYLQSASRLTERPAPVLADLAAAHLMRARATDSPRDLFRALEAAERALEHEPGNVAARFNAAVALERIGTPYEGAEAWSRYLEADSTSAWADEARKRARVALPEPVRAPRRTASAAELEAFAAARPSAARELGWDDLLREWGAAVLAGDTATARARLHQAEAIGTVLVRRGGDASLNHAVAAIRRNARSAAALRRLARAHRELGEGRKMMVELDHEAGCPRFRPMLAADTPPHVREWAQAFAGFCTAYGVLAVDVGQIASRSDTLRYPAAAGRTWLALAIVRSRAGSYQEALAAYTRARALLTRAGERDYAAAARAGEGNTLATLGDANAGYAVLHESLQVLRQYPGSVGLWNTLYSLRNALLADGLPLAAMRVQDEAVAVTRWMQPSLQVEMKLARARLHLAAGRRDIDRDTVGAAAAIHGFAMKYLREFVGADLRQTRAEAWLQRTPGRAAAELDSVVSYFGSGNVNRLLPALFSRAQARLALGMQDSAGADLLRAMTVLDGQRTKLNSAQLRASLLEQSRRVFDQAVMLSVQAGRNEEALDYVERSRASFSPVGRTPGWARRPLRAPRGEAAVVLALVSDTLLAWTLWDGGLHLTRRTVRSAELVRTAERVRSALELRARDTVALPGLQSLYDELIRPLLPRLGREGIPLTIVADGELAGIPMAALHDRERGRFLVEDHPLRFASSLRDPAGLPAASAGLPLALVADPAFDRRAFPELQPLPGAAAEVEAIARGRPGARVLDGTHANASAVRAAFRRGGIAHFAGHAVFDDARPERSFLVVAAGGSMNTTDRLTAAEIEKMQLGGLRLVVLSACQTSRAQAGRSGGFAGLAGAFLAAGAGGVVGSLWQVDDEATRALMERFHAAYARSGDAARSLRQAQLEMLRAAEPALRSPAAWAGFRYAGS